MKDVESARAEYIYIHVHVHSTCIYSFHKKTVYPSVPRLGLAVAVPIRTCTKTATAKTKRGVYRYADLFVSYNVFNPPTLYIIYLATYRKL